MQQFTSIGYTKKLYGTKGNLRLNIKEAFLESFEQTELLFLEINGRKIPYFIQQKIYTPSLQVVFEDHSTREKAQALTGKEIFLTEKYLILSENFDELEYAPYIGYLIKDLVAGDIGIVEDIEEYPQQEMALVAYQNRTILIPLNEHLIKEIKEEDKIILVHLPDGLLSL